jgi:radical SAM protein with 4Fe4S-binding SPASM domain
MPMATFQKTLDFLERSNISQARLLGGEPTQHPNFEKMTRVALKRGFNLLLFSNGHMPDETISFLSTVPENRITLLVNLSSGDHKNCWGMSKRQKKVLRCMGDQTIVGINIYRPKVRIDGLLDVIGTYQLKPVVRIGIAHPCISKTNDHLYPHEYQPVGRHLITFGRDAEKRGVTIEFDCGVVPCMFPEDPYNVFKKSTADLGQRCNPVLDILPDGSVASCFPLTNWLRFPMPDNKDADWLRARFEQKLLPYHNIGIFKDCSICELFKGKHCRGGCIATAITRLRQANKEPQEKSSIERVDDNRGYVAFDAHVKPTSERSAKTAGQDKIWVLPYIDQPSEFWRQLADTHKQSIREIYFPLPVDSLGSGRPPQPSRYLYDFLRSNLMDASVLINPLVLPEPVEKMTHSVIQTLEKLMTRYSIVGATVTNLELAVQLKTHFPELSMTASVLMDIYTPLQATMIEGVFDILVPSGRILRDLAALKALRKRFDGKIRLMVNEACLPGCPYRNQHFYEMGKGFVHPESLCRNLLESKPWLRLTGSWVLPQHLHFYDGIFDEIKLAGRVTLQLPEQYRRVVHAYMNRQNLTPDAIGGGPASVLTPMTINDDFFFYTLSCKKGCSQCGRCEEYYRKNISL